MIYGRLGGVVSSIILLSVLAEIASANTIVRSRSAYDSSDPYEIVLASDKNDTSLEPGIYALVRGKENGQLIAAGTVLDANRNFSGVLGAFSMSQMTQRNESIAILNGKLVIFANIENKQLAKGNETKILTFGENVTIRDALTGNRVALAPISSTNESQISVFINNNSRDSDLQLFLFSVNQPNLMGTGLTVVGALKRTLLGLQLVGDPVVIDYNFQSANALEKLLVSDRHVYSRLHLLNVAEPRASDDRILRRYRENAKRFASELKQNVGLNKAELKKPVKSVLNEQGPTGSPIFTPPIYAVDKRELILKLFPMESIPGSKIPIVQRTDPFQGHSGLYFGNATPNPAVTPDFAGRVDYDVVNHRYMVVDLRAAGGDSKRLVQLGDDSEVTFLSVDQIPVLLFTSRMGGKSSFRVISMQSQLNRELFTAKKMSGFKISVPESPNSASLIHFIFFSYEMMSGKTFVIKILETPEYTKVIDLMPILNSYATVKELAARIKRPDANNDLLFDSVSQRLGPVKGQEDPQQYLALTDLKASARTDVIHRYLKPLNQVTLVAPNMFWREYDPRGVKELRTGIYLDKLSDMSSNNVTVDPAHYTRFLPGRILTEADRPAQTTGAAAKIRKKLAALRANEDEKKKEPIRFTHTLTPQKGSLPDAKLTFIPYMADNPQQKVGFNLALLIEEDTGGSRRTMLPNIVSFYLPFDFSRLMGLKVVQARRKHSDEFVILVFVSEKDAASAKAGPTRGGPGIYVINQRLINAPRGDLGHYHLQHNSESNDGIWLQMNQVSPEQLKSRITYDSDGRPLWVITPELEKNDKGYQVRYFNTNAEKGIFVNAGVGRVSVRWDEWLDDDWELEYSRKSRWHVSHKSTLETKIQGYAKYLEEVRKLEDALKKKNKRQVAAKNETLFLELNDYLEQVVSANTRHQHTVLLVEPSLLQTLRLLMVHRLTERGEKAHDWSLENIKLNFNIYDPSFPLDETLDNLSRIGRSAVSRDVLYVDLETVIEAERADPPTSFKVSNGVMANDGRGDPSAIEDQSEAAKAEEEESPTEADKDEEDHVEIGSSAARKKERILKFPYSRLAYLAAEGENVSMRRFSEKMPAKRMSTVILATPAQWRQYQESFPEETRSGVFNQFNIDARFLTGPWTVWPPNSSRVSKEIALYQQGATSKDEFLVFNSLDRILREAALPRVKAKHQLLVVPEELKPLIHRLILSRWATNSNELEGPWSHKNKELALFQLGTEGVTQDQIGDNYESMRGALASRRPVLYADMSAIIRVGRPQTEVAEKTYRLRDPLTIGRSDSTLLNIESRTTESGEVVGGENEVERTQIPHMIWWIASEGRRIQPKKHKGWSLHDEAKPQIPTLVLATEKELETLKQDAAFESRFLGVNDVFEVTRFERPTDQEKTKFLEDLFQRPNISSLEYKFIHQNLESNEARKQLIGLLIGQVEQISRQLKLEPTYAFLKVYSALHKSLTDDVETRRNRTIDAPMLFRLFAKVFPLPLTYEILRADDPFQKTRDLDRASRGLEEAGYHGPMELKTRHFRNITAHTRGGGSEGARRIPSSQVLIGDPGTGKSFLLEVTARYLNLKPYDFNKPHEEDVGSFTLNCMNLTEEPDPAHPEKIDVKRALQHLSNFLAMPNGWRGMVTIDDLHKAATPKILSQITTYLQGMLDAPNGILEVRRLSTNPQQLSKVVEIPVRNIILSVTLNPTKDRDIRKRFLAEWKKEPAMEAVAALTREGYTVEESLFSRFADVIDMDEFPSEAKTPAILNSVRGANAAQYATRPHLTLVTPDTLASVMDQFQSANARDLIEPATFALLNLPSEMRKAPIYLIDSQLNNKDSSKSEIGEGPAFHGWGVESKKVEPGKIEAALRRSTKVHTIHPQDPVSKLQFLSFMADNFRGLVYFALILDAQNSPLLTSSYEARTTNLFSLLAAVLGNISEFRRLPLSQMNIKPQELGVFNLDSITNLQKEIKNHPSNAKMPTVRIPTSVFTDDQVDLASFLGDKGRTFPERRRLDVMVETTAALQKSVEQLLAKIYQVSNLTELTSQLNWINGLTETDPKAAFRTATEEMFRIYLRFSKELYDINLDEVRNSQGIVNMQSYDEARLFLLCLDRALSQLPWSFLTEFTLKAVDLAGSDLAIGQKMGLQHFLFKSNFSPMATITPESIISNVRGMSAVRGLTPERENKYHDGFRNNCEKFLRQPPVDEGQR